MDGITFYFLSSIFKVLLVKVIQKHVKLQCSNEYNVVIKTPRSLVSQMK